MAPFLFREPQHDNDTTSGSGEHSASPTFEKRVMCIALRKDSLCTVARVNAYAEATLYAQNNTLI